VSLDVDALGSVRPRTLGICSELHLNSHVLENTKWSYSSPPIVVVRFTGVHVPVVLYSTVPKACVIRTYSGTIEQQQLTDGYFFLESSESAWWMSIRYCRKMPKF